MPPSPDLAISGGLLIGVTALVIAVAALVHLRMPALHFVLAALLVLALDEFLLFKGFGLLPSWMHAFGQALHWNWAGKVYAIIGTVAVCLLWPGISMKEFGFTFRQRSGSVVAAFVTIAAICLLQWASSYISGGGDHPDAQTILYQATMPGFEEEPFWRALFLVLLNKAFHDQRWNLAGAQIGWGAIIGSLVFGLAHGLNYSDGAFHFSFEIVALISVIGFLLAWIRERTGSIALSVVAHNVGNVGNQLLYFLH